MHFSPNEFIVEEITTRGIILELNKEKNLGEKEDAFIEKNFTHFILQKKQWNTAHALKAIAGFLHISSKRFNSAGMKDRNSTSTQLCSVFAVDPQKLLEVKVKDLQINGAWKAREKVKLGDLLGNCFTITLTKENTGKKVDANKIKKNALKNNFLFPNYFGEQRFGSLRKNSHLVGKLLVQKKFEEAVWNFLCFVSEKEGRGGAEARRKLSEEKDFGKALGYFPLHLKYERTILGHLNEFPNDFIGAFRKLPRSLQLLFIHAYQSFLFNELLEKRIVEKKLFTVMEGDFFCPTNAYGFPDLNKVGEIVSEKQLSEVQALVGERKAFLVGEVVGCESSLNEEEKRLLEEEGVNKQDFFLKSLPELSSKGTKRPLFSVLKNFCVEEKDFGSVAVTFELPAGSYATVALQELLGL